MRIEALSMAIAAVISGLRSMLMFVNMLIMPAKHKTVSARLNPYSVRWLVFILKMSGMSLSFSVCVNIAYFSPNIAVKAMQATVSISKFLLDDDFETLELFIFLECNPDSIEHVKV